MPDREKQTLSDGQYMACQARLLSAVCLIAGLPLEDFLRRAELADTLAPMLDPTPYREGGGCPR